MKIPGRFLSCLVLLILSDYSGFAGEYFPLSEGSVWKFRGADGKNIVQKITREEKLGFYPGFLMETSVDGQPLVAEHLGDVPDGLVRFSLNGIRFDTPVVLLKSNSKPGDKWPIEINLGNEPVKGTIKVVEEQITVPAGKYSCLVTFFETEKESKEKVTFKVAYAPKVGPVRQEFQKGESKPVIFELQEYTPVVAKSEKGNSK